MAAFMVKVHVLVLQSAFHSLSAWLYRQLCAIRSKCAEQPNVGVPGSIGDKNDKVTQTRDEQVSLLQVFPFFTHSKILPCYPTLLCFRVWGS